MKEQTDKKEKISEEEEDQNKKIEEENLREKKNLDKYRINFLSFANSVPNTKIKTLCPICSKVPDIKLRQYSTDIYVKCLQCRYCYCCSHPRSKTLDDYISIMVKLQQDNIKCEIHKEKGIEEEGFFSCEICQKWMCEECINAHITENDDHYYYIARKIVNNNYYTHCPKHKLEYKYFLTEHFMTGCNRCPSCIEGFISNGIDDELLVIPIEKGEFHLNQLKSIITEGVEYLDKYCKNIYDILIKSISKKPDLLQKAKKIYNDFLIRNRRVLFYYQMVVNTATPSFSNYNLIGNISNSLLTKFETIDISPAKNLNEEEINNILSFFENNYIVGIEEKEMKNIKEFNIKEINTLKLNEDNMKNETQEIIKKERGGEKEEEEEEEKKKTVYIGIIVLNKNIVCACSDDGFIHIFQLEKSLLSGKHILSKKIHDKEAISLDNLKNTNDHFVTCDRSNFKIWKLKGDKNKYDIECETIIKNPSDSVLIFLYVLNNSDSISFVNDNNYVYILNTQFKPFYKVNFNDNLIKALYQINSEDDNDGLFIIGGEDYIIFFKIIGGIKYLGSIKEGCFGEKSLFYLGNNILMAGNKSDINLINVKTLKLENTIRIPPSECCCFLKYKDMVICGYEDTSNCSAWSNGIALTKETKFLIVKKNNKKFKSILISDEFYNYGIANAIWLDNSKFISFFHNDESLKIIEIK